MAPNGLAKETVVSDIIPNALQPGDWADAMPGNAADIPFQAMQDLKVSGPEEMILAIERADIDMTCPEAPAQDHVDG
jgi:hypothetical protein